MIQCCESWQRILNADKAISLTKISFGLYLAHYVSEKHSQFKNIVFYEIDVPPNEDLSEIILTLNGSLIHENFICR